MRDGDHERTRPVFFPDLAAIAGIAEESAGTQPLSSLHLPPPPPSPRKDCPLVVFAATLTLDPAGIAQKGGTQIRRRRRREVTCSRAARRLFQWLGGRRCVPCPASLALAFFCPHRWTIYDRRPTLSSLFSPPLKGSPLFPPPRPPRDPRPRPHSSPFLPPIASRLNLEPFSIAEVA